MQGGHHPILHQQLFGERLAHSLYHTTLDLSLMRERVDNRPDIMRGHQLAELNLTSFGVHLYLSHLGTKGRDRDRPSGHVTASAGERRSPLLCRPSHERCQVQATAVSSDEAALVHLYLRGRTG